MTLSDINITTHLKWLDFYLERANRRHLSPDDKESMQWLLEQIHTLAPEQYPAYRDRFLTALPSFEKRLRAFEQNVGKTVLQRRVDFFAPGRDAYVSAQVIRALPTFFKQDDFHPAPDVDFDELADMVEAIVTNQDFSHLSYVVGLMMHLADHAFIPDCIALVDGARGLIQLVRDDFFVVDPPTVDLFKNDSEEAHVASNWSRIFHDDLFPVIGYELDHQAIFRALSDLDPSVAEFYLQTVIEAKRPPITLGDWLLVQENYFVILIDAAANLARTSGQNQGEFVPLEQVWEQFLYLLLARVAQKLPPMLWHEDREELLVKAVAFQEALRGMWQSPLPVALQPETPVPALPHSAPRENGQGGGIKLSDADGPVAFDGIQALAMPSYGLEGESELSDRPLFQIVGGEEPAAVSPIAFQIVGVRSAASTPAIDDRPVSDEASKGSEGMKILGVAVSRPVIGSASTMSFALRVIR